MSRKRGLGRGLDALLGAAREPGADADRSADDEQVRQVPVNRLVPGRYQPRQTVDETALEALAASIRVRGILQPLVVRRSSDAGLHEIVAGERRWRAAQLAGLDTVPVLVREIDDHAALAIGLIENIQREDLNPLEEAVALVRLVEEFGLTHDAVARAVGRSRAAVSNLLRLLDLGDEARRFLSEGLIDMGHARALLGLTGRRQADCAREVVARSLSVRETEALVKRLSEPARTTSPRTPPDPNVRSLQDRLSERLGTPVQIESGRGGRGRLVIRYGSLEELDGILEHIR